MFAREVVTHRRGGIKSERERERDGGGGGGRKEMRVSEVINNRQDIFHSLANFLHDDFMYA
jgi:hypothetical protein